MGSDVENVVATPISEAVRQHEAGGSGFVGGTSPAMLTLEAVISEIAHTNIPVLLVGECGTRQADVCSQNSSTVRPAGSVDENLVRWNES